VANLLHFADVIAPVLVLAVNRSICLELTSRRFIMVSERNNKGNRGCEWRM